MFGDSHFKITHKYCISSIKPPGAYLMSRLSGEALIGGRCLKEGCAGFKQRRVIYMKFENFVIVSFQINVNDNHCDI